MPTAELFAAMGKYNVELAAAGIMKAGDGLRPSKEGVRVRFSGASREVIDGPFTETNEVVAGFWLWEVGSMEEAIAWVKKCPNPMMEDSDIEIRPLFEMEDFSDLMTPELREQEEKLREALRTHPADRRGYIKLSPGEYPALSPGRAARIAWEMGLKAEAFGNRGSWRFKETVVEEVPHE